MLPLPNNIIQVMSHFSPLFSKRVWSHAQILLTGAILCPGKRTVSAALRVMSLDHVPHFQTYHRVLNRVIWSPLKGSYILLRCLIDTFAPSGPLVFGLDDTIERRRGDKICAKGIYRDPVGSSHSHFVKASGLRWLSLMLLTDIPFASRVWALPFMSVLCPSERYYKERGRKHQTLLERAVKMLHLLSRWVPYRALIVVADSSFAALEFLDAVRGQVTMITRLRLDAALYEPAPLREPGTNGRPRKKGQRQPCLEQRLIDPDTTWQQITVEKWYGKKNRRVKICSDTAVWYHNGMPPVPIRWVLVKDPHERLAPQAFLSTDPDLNPEQILFFFIRRWQVETTFEEARAHLGMETQRQYNDRAIERTTPVILALFSIVTLIANRLIENPSCPIRTSAWYPKERPTFSDALAWVRRVLWETFCMSYPQKDVQKLPELLLNRMIDTLCYAA